MEIKTKINACGTFENFLLYSVIYYYHYYYYYYHHHHHHHYYSRRMKILYHFIKNMNHKFTTKLYIFQIPGPFLMK